MLRAIYRILIQLHPDGFRDRNGAEMLDIFGQTRDRATQMRFLADALLSLGRQWLVRGDVYPRMEPVSGAPGFQLIETPRTRMRTWMAGGLLSLLLMQAISWSAMHGGGRFPIARLFDLEGAIDKAQRAVHPMAVPAEPREVKPREERIPFPDTPAGKAFQEWAKALNAGDRRGLERFFEKRINDPAGPHANVWLEWRNRFGALTPHTLERSSEFDIAVRATAGDRSEWRIELTLAAKAPHGLVKLIPERLSGGPQL